MLFERNDIAFGRGKFRVRGDVVEVHPAYLDETAIRVEFFDDEVERITSIHTLTGHMRSNGWKATRFSRPSSSSRPATR